MTQSNEFKACALVWDTPFSSDVGSSELNQGHLKTINI
jgi:hypothetical protein